MPATTPSISHCWRASAGPRRATGPDRWAGPHGEDVAEMPPTPVAAPGRARWPRGGCGSRSDGHRDAVAGSITRVLPGPDQHVGALGGEPSQMDPGRLVGAVLAPHHREQGELEMVGRPSEDGLDLGRAPRRSARAPGGARLCWCRALDRCSRACLSSTGVPPTRAYPARVGRLAGSATGRACAGRPDRPAWRAARDHPSRSHHPKWGQPGQTPDMLDRQWRNPMKRLSE